MDQKCCSEFVAQKFRSNMLLSEVSFRVCLLKGVLRGSAHWSEVSLRSVAQKCHSEVLRRYVCRIVASTRRSGVSLILCRSVKVLPRRVADVCVCV